MRVFMTGYSGYIGPVMAKVLVAEGHQITALDTGYFAECSMEPESNPLPVIRKDLRDLTSQDLDGFDAVVHLAALANDSMGELRPELTYDINHRGSVHLARLAREAGVSRFLFSSSCSVYGTSSSELAKETAALMPLTTYAISKIRTEEDLDKLADSSFSPVYMRNATAYGVSPRQRLDLVLNNLAAWAYTTGCVQIMSDGTPWRPLVHIEDISAAFAAALRAPREAIHNNAFNVGTNEDNYRVRDLADFVLESMPNCKITYSGQSAPDPRNYRVDFSKIRTQLPGFKPRWNARAGAIELRNALTRVDLKLEDFQSRNYIREKQLRHLMDSGCLDDTLRWKQVT
jgi:nucleoside-diphosphate-sugar epimerase